MFCSEKKRQTYGTERIVWKILFGFKKEILNDCARRERERKNTKIFTFLMKSSIFVSHFYLREITKHFPLSLALSFSLSCSFPFIAATFLACFRSVPSLDVPVLRWCAGWWCCVGDDFQSFNAVYTQQIIMCMLYFVRLCYCHKICFSFLITTIQLFDISIHKLNGKHSLFPPAFFLPSIFLSVLSLWRWRNRIWIAICVFLLNHILFAMFSVLSALLRFTCLSVWLCCR